MDLLRLTTAGSVDDGKSTLIGRLLYDSKSIFQDQIEQLAQSSQLRGEDGLNLALLTDGLRAEREQGITIDVAYRYFSTPKRKFIIADTPGHEQYTRNMVTGASTADVAIVLVDARNGITTQTKRHGFIASLLAVPHIIVAINKMDLVDYSEERFDELVHEYKEFSKKLSMHDISFIPMAALHGDNIVHKSSAMSWYEGSTLMHRLESVTISADANLVDFRLPVQMVVRGEGDFRGYAGLIASGAVRVGEELLLLPSLQESRVKEILSQTGPVQDACAGESVLVSLEDQRDVSRGDMLVRKNNLPQMTNQFEAMICWMDSEKTLDLQTRYILRHTTNQVLAYVSEVDYCVDVNTLKRCKDAPVDLNAIARVSITSAKPIFCDTYQANRATGSFVLIDPISFRTVAAGMIRSTQSAKRVGVKTTVSSNVMLDEGMVTREHREARSGHKAMVLWLTGLSGSGKSTIAKQVEVALFEQGKSVVRLDGDNLRHGLCGDLGFSAADRKENIRRAAQTATLLFERGNIVICSFVSPFTADREFARSLVPEGRFIEVFVDCSLEECMKRDTKGLYKKAMAGEIAEFTGVSSPYSSPENPDLHLITSEESEQNSVARVLKFVEERIAI